MARLILLSGTAVLLASSSACSSSQSDAEPGGAMNGDGDPMSGDGDMVGDGDGVVAGDADLASATGGSGATASSGEILMHATFEGRTVGPYTEDMIEGDFGNPTTWNDGLDEGRATIKDDGAGPYLRVTYPAGQYGPGPGGVQFKVPLGAGYTELFLSYRVRFGADFEWVKGGKLPGLVGGSAPTGCVADDTGFSARMMWRTGGHAVQYLYFPDKVEACGDDYGYQSGGTDVFFRAGTWHTVQHRIVMNTPGTADGVMQAWFDGELVLDEQAFMWRRTGMTWDIDTLYFSTFFGGGDATWAPTADQAIDYDDFVIATGPIQQ